MTEVQADQSQVSVSQTRTAKRIAARLLWILDRARFRSRNAEYSAFGMVAKRSQDGTVFIKVLGIEFASKLSPDRSNRLKSKRGNIDFLASRLTQHSAVLAHLCQVM
jgi:hypothetical protein